MTYSFYHREINPSWSILQMEHLIEIAKIEKSSTLISYAALEGRINLERIEVEILGMALHGLEDSGWQVLIDKQNGIQKVNDKYKVLKYRYQTFTEAFSKVIGIDFEIKYFDFKKALEMQSSLSQYIHLQTRTGEELQFESEFMQLGVSQIEQTIDYFKNMSTTHNGAYIYGVLEYQSLKNGFEIEFEKWMKSVSEDVEALTERLKKIEEDYMQ